MRRIIRLKPITLYLLLITAFILGKCFNLSAAGQVTLSLKNSTGYILKPESFLDLDILNGNSYSMHVFVEVDLYDLQKQLMKLTTDYFMVPAGFTSLNSSSVGIKSTEYYDESFRAALQEAGVFPPGSYKYEIKLIMEEVGPVAHLTGDEQLELGPPQLIYPLNNAQINTHIPVLTWHGPVTLSLEGQPLKYELKLVELLSGQTPLAAIGENPAVFSEGELAQESLPYPPNAKELEDGKSYAWQVTAYSRRLIVGKTEVWKFTVESEKPEKQKLPNGTYLTLRENLDAGNAKFTNLLLLKVDGFTARNEPIIHFYNEQQKDITPKELKIIQEYGDNRLAVNLTPYQDFKSGGTYFMEMRTVDGKIYKLRFNYYKDKSNEQKKHKFLGLF